MSELRDLIRAIMREEIEALRSGAKTAPAIEQVRLVDDRDLAAFVKDIAERCDDPDFRKAIANGAHRFSLRPAPETPAAPASPRAALVADNQVFGRGLVTEKDIAAMDHDRKVLRIAAGARLTPLAQDEARRRGIRIERAQR
jgi:hypothetical protein